MLSAWTVEVPECTNPRSSGLSDHLWKARLPKASRKHSSPPDDAVHMLQAHATHIISILELRKHGSPTAVTGTADGTA